jgi:hypothetical protein
MARGDPPNGGMRQMRDPRSVDDHNQQYQQDPRVRMSQQMSDQGRSTPPPRREDPRDLDYATLLQKHEELQAKYSKVKRYYFDREAQVTHLQNTVANQRLSMSKTSLDDAQYSSRFDRLSGAINNLSFNIRKDWKNVPPWLRPVCNQDAHTTGTKEMTAVGRACITRWLYETVFQQVFHPAIEHSVSRNLKHIEQSLRRQGTTGLAIQTDEQRDDLLTKITTWRLTTMEGLQDQLMSNFAPQYQENLLQSLTIELTNSLKANLNEPPPAGLQESVSTIISQAVSICANIPMESRDICIEYFMPGRPIDETYMKVETGMTPLTTPGLDERVAPTLSSQSPGSVDDEDEDRERDVEAEIREATKAAQQGNSGSGQGRSESINSMPLGGSQSGMKSGDKRDGSRTGQKETKGGFLGAFVGGSKKPAPSQSRQGSTREREPERGGSQSERQQRQVVAPSEEGSVEDRSIMNTASVAEPQQMASLPPLVPGEGRIRFAVFLTVEVRGKMLKETPAAGPGGEGAGAASTGPGTQSSAAAKNSIQVLCKAPVYEL